MAWTSLGNLKGPKGDKGDPGDPGADGADSTVPGPEGAGITAGSGAPSAEIPNTKLYIDTDTGDLYSWSA